MKVFVFPLLWALSAANPDDGLDDWSHFLDLSDVLDISGDSMNPNSQSVFSVSTGEEVHAVRGDDALLRCSFTHPRFSTYLGHITVKWIARDATDHPFFTCSFNSSSDEDLSWCSFPRLKYALPGDPRQGELSLLIKDVTPLDEEVYFCRVEIEDESDTSRGINLRVGVKPQILSLKELNGTRNGRSLECVVEGHPPPHISWFSKSKSQLEGLIDDKKSGPTWVTSYLWFDQDDRFTCHAENPLGWAEQTYPPRSSLVLIVRVAVFGFVLLVSMGLVVWKLRRVFCSVPGDSQHATCPSGEDPRAVPLDNIPVYQNQTDDHEIRQSPAGGAVDPRPGFCTVDVHL